MPIPQSANSMIFTLCYKMFMEVNYSGDYCCGRLAFVVLFIFAVYNEYRYMSKTYNTSSSPFFSQVKEAIRVCHYSIWAEHAYLG